MACFGFGTQIEHLQAGTPISRSLNLAVSLSAGVALEQCARASNLSMRLGLAVVVAFMVCPLLGQNAARAMACLIDTGNEKGVRAIRVEVGRAEYSRSR